MSFILPYHKPIQLIPPAIHPIEPSAPFSMSYKTICINHPIRFTLFNQISSSVIHSSHSKITTHSIPRTPPPHIRVPITSNQQPFIPTHTQLALQVPSSALQAHLVCHPDRLVHGYQPNPFNQNRRHPLINPLLLPLLDPPQQRCSPQQNPRLPAVVRSIHHITPKKLQINVLWLIYVRKGLDNNILKV